MLGFLLRKDWAAPYKHIYRGYLLMLLTLIVALLVGLANVPYNALPWFLTSTTELVQVPLHQYSLGLFQIEVPTDNYLISQHFQGGPFRYSHWQAVVHLLVVGLGIVLMLTVVTYLGMFWYTVSMGIFIMFLMALQLDQLLLFGLEGIKPVIGVVLLYLLLSYYFQALNTSASLLTRWLAFAGLTFVLSLLIHFFAQVDQPWLYLANFGVFGPVILSIFFMMLIGMELVYLILYLVTQSAPQFSKHNFRHFLIFTIVYLLNVGLAYAKAARHIDWDILYINAFVLLVLSVLVGLWSFGQREEGYHNIIRFYPYGGLLFLALGVICISTVRYQIVLGNDPLMETLEDAILFGHLGFGSMFFIYIVANFITPLIKNLQVYKIAFKESNFPFATANLAGMVVVLALYFMGDQATLNQAIAGMYNLGGDIWRGKNQDLAKHLYYQSSVYGYNNHRANYMLGMMENEAMAVGKAIVHYESAIAKHPSPQAYVNLSNLYRDNNAYFDALFTLQEGVAKFPKDGPLKNNLALLYAKTSILDSTIYYLQQVDDIPMAKRAAEVNLLSFYTKKGLLLNLDSTAAIYVDNMNLAAKVNLMAYANKYFSGTNEDFDPMLAGDSALNAHTYSYAINSYTNRAGSRSIGGDQLSGYIDYPRNGEFKEQLMFVNGWANYRSGRLAQAFLQWDIVAHSSSPNQAYFNNTIALMAIDQRAYNMAIEYFSSARSMRYNDSINTALAYLEAGKTQDAVPYIVGIQDNTMRADLMAAGYMDAEQIPDTNDPIRYLALRYRHHVLGTDLINEIIESFKDMEFREGAILMLTRKALDKGDYEMANVALAKIPFATSPERENELVLLLDFLKLGSGQSLELNMDEIYLMELTQAHIVKLYQAKTFHMAGDSTKAASLYQALGNDNPFFIEGVLASADYYNAIGDRDNAYLVLQQAIDINKYSVPLIKRYIDQSIMMNMPQYAENVLLRLLDLLPLDKYKQYEAEVDAKLQAQKEKMADWMD